MWTRFSSSFSLICLWKWEKTNELKDLIIQLCSQTCEASDLVDCVRFCRQDFLIKHFHDVNRRKKWNDRLDMSGRDCATVYFMMSAHQLVQWAFLVMYPSVRPPIRPSIRPSRVRFWWTEVGQNWAKKAWSDHYSATQIRIPLIFRKQFQLPMI